MGGSAYIATRITRAGRDRAHRPDGAAAVRPAAARAARRGGGLPRRLPRSKHPRRAPRGHRARELGEVRLPGRRCRAPPRVTRSPLGVVRADPDMRWLFEQAMRETWSLARARGVAAARRLRRAALAFAETLHTEMRASLLHDLEAGDKLEAPWLCGAVARMSARGGPRCAGEPRGVRRAQALRQWPITASSSSRPTPPRARRSCAQPGRSWPSSSRASSPAPTAPAARRATGTLATVLEIRRAGHEAAPHLSCVGSTRKDIAEQLARYRAQTASATWSRCAATCPPASATAGEFRYANELVAFIRETQRRLVPHRGGLLSRVPPAGALRRSDDLRNFKRKVDAGADSAITQYFFNADAYFHFVDEARARRRRGADRAGHHADHQLRAARALLRRLRRRDPALDAPASWKASATTRPRSAPSASTSSPRCASGCSTAARRACTSTR